MARATEAARPEEPRELASEIPTKHLPGIPYADMPEPLPFRKVVGPSVILLGTAIASGELILWPYIAAKVGLVFLWAAYVGLLTQYFINMEVERYTLATGETAVTGFTRLWKPWGLIFVVLTALPNIWPAWATGAATFFTFATEWGSVRGSPSSPSWPSA